MLTNFTHIINFNALQVIKNTYQISKANHIVCNIWYLCKNNLSVIDSII